MTIRRSQVTALVLAALGTVALWAHLLTTAPGSSAPAAAARPATARTPTPGTTTPRATAPAPSPTTSGPRLRALFLGDSYAAAGGRASYPRVAARILHWPAVVDAEPGTGFLVPSRGPQGQRRFADRLRTDLATRPAVVVIAGGADDAGNGYRPADEQRAAAALLRDVRHRLPHAAVVVVGPFAPMGTPDGELTAFRDALQAAATTAGAGFVDPLRGGWITGGRAPEPTGNAPRYIDPAGRPTAAGADYLGQRLAAALAALHLS